MRGVLARRALQLGMGLQILQQATGINTIMYYSATIMEMARSASGGEDQTHEHTVEAMPQRKTLVR
eukprot:2475992-Amphidinium_carterae.1